jgi:hypothetical protein
LHGREKKRGGVRENQSQNQSRNTHPSQNQGTVGKPPKQIHCAVTHAHTLVTRKSKRPPFPENREEWGTCKGSERKTVEPWSRRSIGGGEAYAFDDGAVAVVGVEEIERRVVLHPEQIHRMVAVGFFQGCEGLFPFTELGIPISEIVG